MSLNLIFKKMSAFKNNIYLKVGIIVIVTLLLLIPSSMIKSLINEREYSHNEAINEVSNKWAGSQTLSGPFISIPYYRYSRQYSTKDSTEKIVKLKEYLHFLPDMLEIDVKIEPEKRYRGIYEVVVYNSVISVKGKFNRINYKEFEIPIKDLILDKAFLSYGISDMRGIEELINLNLNGNNSQFNPGTISFDIIDSGINTPVYSSINDSTGYSFEFRIKLKGSQQLYFIPVGKETNVKTESEWKNPSFNGAFLPDKRQVDDKGSMANWNILHLNRNFPQSFAGALNTMQESSFGIDLLVPVDNYQKTTRCAKYSLMFIAITFLVFFFVEILNKKFIHPIQYILVGLSLIVFFALLLSISEYLNFNLAYLIASLASLLLIACYVKAILQSSKLSLLISSILAILFIFIFIILQLEDYALLIGSIFIFLILAVTMYLSRKIDWYSLKMGE